MRPFFMALCVSLSACVATPPRQTADPAVDQVRILRDEWGVPHIYADSVYGLYYGYGYAVGQDRLFQMEMARRSTQGTVAAVLGQEYLAFDQGVRRGFDPASIRNQVAALAPQDHDLLAGYAAGINARLTEVRASPGRLLPLEFSFHDFAPADWTAYDVAMVFVGTMANRYADFNTELENAQILAQLTERHGAAAAGKIFDSLNPRFTVGAPTSISDDDWQPPPELAQVTTHPGPLHGLNDLTEPTPGHTGFSNALVLGPAHLDGADAVLLNGPQFGWYTPAYTYSVGLHGAGFDVVGNTPFAYPGLLFGHNQFTGWGSTWGAGDMVDIFAEALHPDDPSRYRVGDGWQALDTRQEIIAVRGADPVTIEVQRSRNGPIIARDEAAGVAYAKRRTWDGEELQALLAWVHLMRAKDFEDFLAEADRLPFNINWYYADVRGNIGYVFAGHYPDRDARHDNRLPVSGLDWQGLQGFEDNPHAVNPQSGFIANWNNKPAPGVRNPDEFWYSWSGADRVEVLHQAVAEGSPFRPDQVWDLLEPSSYADVNAPYLVGPVSAAVAGDAGLAAAARVLADWDQYSRDSDEDGFYDEPGTALFRTFLGHLLAEVLADDLGSAFAFFAATGYPTPESPSAAGVNIQTGTKAVIEALNGRSAWDFFNGEDPAAVLRRALAASVAELTAAQGADPDGWRLPVAPRSFSHKNFLGVPQTLPQFALANPIDQNRGTENNLFVFVDGKVVGYESAPPGQSGFVSPDGEPAPHFADQLKPYAEFGRKRMWFTEEEVRQAAQSELTLGVTRPLR